MLRRFGVTVLLPGVVLLLFGLRALEQDRSAVDRQIHDRMENAAALAARTIDQQLANWEQLRGDGITLAGNPVKLTPEQRSAYEVAEEAALEVQVPPLADAEQQEFRGDLGRAINLYQRAAAKNPTIRAEALLRLGETYSKAGKRDLAAATYRDLLRLPEKRIQTSAIELVARFELCEMGRGDRASFYHDLVAGRWRLDKARYLFYSDAARDWNPEPDPVRGVEREKLATSAAIEDYLQHRRRLVGDFVAFWNDAETVILPAAKLRQKLEQSAAVDRELKIQLADNGSARPLLSASHDLSDRDLPWLVEAAPLDAARLYEGANQRRVIYLAMLLFVFLVLAAGTYMTAHAVNREMEVVRLKSEFVSTVSHEFRSPLTAIRQLSELLQRGRITDEEKRQQYYALICRESGRLSRLVENLLDFSRLEEGRKQFHFERLESSEWLRDLGSSFGASSVSLSIPATLPAIQGDRMALTSAVENLLDNAVKYSPPGSPVALEAEASAAQLTIRVRDQGYGIAEQDRNHVFEKFYRGNGEISRRVKGAGVGLSLVRQIVEAHGGQVDFDTRLGEGSEFRIRLKTV